MKIKFTPILLILIVLMSSPIGSMAQSSKELGINFRNLWFGSSATVVYRKAMSEDRFKRKVFTINGSHNETQNNLSDKTGIPDHFRYNSSSNMSMGVEFGREKRVGIFDELYAYYGPAITTSLGYNMTRNSIGTSLYAQQEQTSNILMTLGLGYLGGIGINITDRFAIQLDNLIQIQAMVSLRNKITRAYEFNTQQEESTVNALDELNRSLQIPGINNTRIWIVYRF